MRVVNFKNCGINFFLFKFEIITLEVSESEFSSVTENILRWLVVSISTDE